MKRILLALAVVVLLVAGGLVYFLASSLDSLVKDAVERYGSEITGTRVRLGSAEIALREGRGTLRNLRVANPEGFSAGDVFALEEISLTLDVGSLGGEPYVVKEVRIQGPVANLEVASNGRTNVDAIRRNVDRYTGASKSSPASEGAGGGASGPETPPPRLRVEKFGFESGHVSVDATALGGERREQDLPPLRLSNLGGARGAPADEIAQKVLSAYTKTIAKTAASSQLQRLLEDELGEGGAGEAAKDLLRRLTD